LKSEIESETPKKKKNPQESRPNGGTK